VQAIVADLLPNIADSYKFFPLEIPEAKPPQSVSPAAVVSTGLIFMQGYFLLPDIAFFCRAVFAFYVYMD